MFPELFFQNVDSLANLNDDLERYEADLITFSGKNPKPILDLFF